MKIIKCLKFFLYAFAVIIYILYYVIICWLSLTFYEFKAFGNFVNNGAIFATLIATYRISADIWNGCFIEFNSINGK